MTSSHYVPRGSSLRTPSRYQQFEAYYEPRYYDDREYIYRQFADHQDDYVPELRRVVPNQRPFRVLPATGQSSHRASRKILLDDGEDDQATSDVGFWKAMRKLHSQISLAEDVYAAFLREFKEDTRAISIYATHQILDDLWVRKVNGANEKILFTYSKVPDPGSGRDHSDKFEDAEIALMTAMHVVVNSELGYGSGMSATTSKYGAMSRLKEKVGMTLEQMKDLLPKATQDRESCQELVDELGLLKSLVDPGSDSNKRLSCGRVDRESNV